MAELAAPPMRIVSGGSTGADIAALRAAKTLGLETTGFAPQGFWNGATADLTLRDVYGLQAMAERGYKEKEEKNVALSDGLLAFRSRQPLTGRGTESVVNCARFGAYSHTQLEPPLDPSAASTFNENPHCPVLVLWDVDWKSLKSTSDRVLAFLTSNKIRSLMVSGPTSVDCEAAIEQLLLLTLARLTDRLAEVWLQRDREQRQKIDVLQTKLTDMQRVHQQTLAAEVDKHVLELKQLAVLRRTEVDEASARHLANSVWDNHRGVLCPEAPHGALLPRDILFKTDDTHGTFVVLHHDGRRSEITIAVYSPATRVQVQRWGRLAAHYLFNVARATHFSKHTAGTVTPP
jgi:hypothetical protein